MEGCNDDTLFRLMTDKLLKLKLVKDSFIAKSGLCESFCIYKWPQPSLVHMYK